jgi:hypothetical protein
MSRSKSTSKDTKDLSPNDIASAIIAALENDEVVTKLASALSTHIDLVLEEKLSSIVKKLDLFAADNKALRSKVVTLEQENVKLKEMNDDLYHKFGNLKMSVNMLEQTSRKCNVVISGVKETFAERTTEASDGETAPANTREDTVRTVCTLLGEACNITASPSDIQFATRLKSKREGPRPLLVGFFSPALRSSVMSARKPKQTLSFRGSSFYINDHLTQLNASLSRNARTLVKQGHAHSTWTRDGQVFIKWTAMDRPNLIRCDADLS